MPVPVPHDIENLKATVKDHAFRIESQENINHDQEIRIQNQEEIYSRVERYMRETRDESVRTNELLSAWGDAKGFIRVVSLVGKTVLWLAAIGGAIAFFLKTGHIK